MMVAFAVPRPSLPPSVREARRTLVERGLSEGPDALTDQEKNVLLGDRVSLAQLHQRVRTIRGVHPSWRQALPHADPVRQTIAMR
jgi:membrane glycosyltransferase